MPCILFLFILWGLISSSFAAPPNDGMNAVAAQYAHLALALGQHDLDGQVTSLSFRSGTTRAGV